MIRHDYWKEYQSLQFEEDDIEYFPLDPFGEVASTFILQSDAFINIAVGSIRSGKTIASIVRFLRYIQSTDYTYFAMAGKTLKALKKNVVRPMKGIMRSLGIKYHHRKSDDEIDILNMGKLRTIVLYGVEKKGSDEIIKGSTYAGAFLDEVTVMDPEGVHMLVSRNSDGDAKIFMTCNPGNPNNFVYTEYVNNQEKLANDDVKVVNFLIDDNPSLSPSYVRHIKSIYPEDSLFYKRNILNQWVSGQGAIYDKFNDDNIYDTYMPLDWYDFVEVGSDYGTSTTTCYEVIGIKEFEDHTQFDVIREYGYDAKREGVTQTDAQRVDDIYNLQEEYHLEKNNTFYVSHDATSLLSALEKDDRIKMSLDTFKPNTLECIQEISSLFYKNYLRIHKSCTETIKQIQGYEWDTKAAQNGEDKPVKKDDHYPDALRAPIITHSNQKEILAGVISF